MKKIFKSLLITLFLCLGFTLNVKADTYTYIEEYVIDRVKTAEVEAKGLIANLTDWSNDYANTAKSVLSKDFLENLEKDDYEHNIDLVVNELKANGHNDAANSLLNMKLSILEDINYLEETSGIIVVYLKEYADEGVLGSADLFIQIRSSLKQLKQPTSDLAKIYYDMYYDDVYNKIDEYEDVSELMDLYERMLEKLEDYDYIISKLEEKLDELQDLYYEYNLQDYEDLFKEELGNYYPELKEDLKKIYTKLEDKLQRKLDEKISDIVDNTDLSDIDSIINRNEKLYDIIDYIEDIKAEVQDKYSKVKTYIKIDTISEQLDKYQAKVIDRFDEAIEYTKTYLLDVFDIGVKKDEDKPFITIDKQLGIIVYDSEELLATTFVNKLFTTVGNFNIVNAYKNNVGTLSILKVMYNNSLLKEFTLIVKGDINPSGRIDISDVVKLCNKMFGKEELNEFEFIAADMNDDSKIDITDVVKLCNKLFK